MGTRGSALALAQSGWLARQVEALEPGVEVETVVIKTSGDRFALEHPSEPAAPSEGAKGLFVKEIEEALARREIDFAVHSAKDLPAGLAPGMHIAAFPRREDARDVFVGRGSLRWSALSAGQTVATSSLRRAIQLRLAKPGVRTTAMRGNVDTRLRKLEEGAADGLLLAAAGLNRLGRAGVPAERIDADVLVPAPGQGALAVEMLEGASDAFELVQRLDDEPTRLAVRLERAFMTEAGGGCSTPLGAYAVVEGSRATLSVFWCREDGSGATRLSRTCTELDEAGAAAFAQRLAAKLPR